MQIKSTKIYYEFTYQIGKKYKYKIAGSIYLQEHCKTYLLTIDRSFSLLHFFLCKKLLSHECVYTLTQQFHFRETILKKFPKIERHA